MASNKATVNIEVLLDGEPVKLEFVRDAIKKFDMELMTGKTVEPEKKILYLCNGHACDNRGKGCSINTFGDCKHTANIEYAKNFKSVGEGVWEEKGIDDSIHKSIISAYLDSSINNWREKKKKAENEEE